MTNREQTVEEILQDIRAVKHKLIVAHMAKGHEDITPSQGFVLSLVATLTTSSIKTLSEALHITSSATTQLVDGLVSNGFLLRDNDPNDRRVVIVKLSKKAQKLVREYKEKGLKQVVALFDILTDTELKQYATLSKKIADSILNEQAD